MSRTTSASPTFRAAVRTVCHFTGGRICWLANVFAAVASRRYYILTYVR